MYSLLARAKVRNGLISAKGTSLALFSKAGMSATVDLPCGIDSVIDNIIFRDNLTSDDLIFNHTLFPYYALGAYPKRLSAVQASMRSGYGGSIHTLLGIMASSIPHGRQLRFCPACFTSDKESFGEAYWHRVHQAPGVLFCPFHMQLLHLCSVKLSKHEFFEANEMHCQVKPQLFGLTDYDIEHLFFISRNINEILKANFWVFEPDWFQKQYLALLQENDLATPRGTVRQKDLRTSFVAFYGERVLAMLDCFIDMAAESSWLAEIVRKTRKATHPLHHILMMIYLAGSVETFFAKKVEFKYFGEGPWPCLNIAADHYKELVIEQVIISYDHKRKNVVGTFACKCGFIYARSGPDKRIEDVYRIGKVKEYGEIWLTMLQQLLKQSYCMREIACRLNCDTATVIRYAKILNNGYVRKNNATASGETGEFYRTAWLQAQQDNSVITKTQLRKSLPRIYAWLYRHDKEWLLNNSPIPPSCNSRVDRVDWLQRDVDLLPQIKLFVKQTLCSLERPIRITISFIGRNLGVLAWLQKHLEKLPACREYLDSVVESEEDFQVRRLKWAADYLRQQGELKEWRLYQIAGIKPKFKEKLGPIVHELIYQAEIRNVNNIV